MTDQQSSTRGLEAQQVLDNPALQDALRMMHDGIIADWKKCPIRDKEGQLLYLQLIRLHDLFQGTLTGMIANGKLADRKIQLDDIRNENPARKALRRVGF